VIELQFTVVGEPVPAPRPRVTKRGVYYPKRYTDWLNQIRIAAADLPRQQGKSPILVQMTFIAKRWKSKDIDNLVKPILDALTGIVWDDDRIVTDIQALKRPPKADEEPKVIVLITEFPFTVEKRP